LKPCKVQTLKRNCDQTAIFSAHFELIQLAGMKGINISKINRNFIKKDVAMITKTILISLAALVVCILCFLKGFTKRNVMTQHTEWLQMIAT
jgi:hypothetical protein